MKQRDETFMRRALELAARGAGQTAPNPNVGAVVVRDDRVVGEGWHARYGTAHAEVVALGAAGVAAKGATVYVTLEPCAHQGKTPPCTGALVAAGVSRVVYAVDDPNPVAAGGAQFLREAGVDVVGGVLGNEVAEVIAPFLFAARGAARPFVTLKLALSIDGALVGVSRRGWLTGPESRKAVHELRASAGAVVVGIETVRADDPALTVRDAPPPRVPPIRVVFDRHARLPLESALVRTAPQVPVLLITAGIAPERERVLAARGVECHAAGTLRDALAFLHARGVQHVLVEGGETLASAFVAAGLVDRLITFRAPVILGAGSLQAFSSLPVPSTPARWRVVARRALGADAMTTYALSGD